MRNSILLTSLLIFSCKSIQQYAGNTNSLNGNWKPVQQEMNGRALPAAAFQTQVLTIQNSLYTLKAESVDKGILRFANGRMDIYGKEGVNTGKHFMAVYARQKTPYAFATTLKEMATLPISPPGAVDYYSCLFLYDPSADTCPSNPCYTASTESITFPNKILNR